MYNKRKHRIKRLKTFKITKMSYRGNIGIILINLSNEDFIINPGDRVAQMVLTRYSICSWKEVDELDSTTRGEGGFGHTGVQ